MTISSPGGFIGGITPENILHAEPRARNRLLAEIFQKIGSGGASRDRTAPHFHPYPGVWQETTPLRSGRPHGSGSPSLTAASMKRWRLLLHGIRELGPPSTLTLCCCFPTCGSIWRLTQPQPPDSVSFPKRACGTGSNSFVSSLIPGWSVVGDKEELHTILLVLRQQNCWGKACTAAHGPSTACSGPL